MEADFRPRAVVEDGEFEAPAAEFLAIMASFGFKVENVVGGRDVEVEDVNKGAISEVNTKLESAS